MRKGIAPIAIVAIVMLALVLVWGVSIYFFIGEHETVVRSSREREIIKLINEMEWVKRLMPQVLEYSFYQSNYFLASNGDYYDSTAVASYNCVPYWRIYDETYLPDLKENLNKTLIKYMNDYAAALRISLPDYEIDYQDEDGATVVTIKSDGNLKLERGIARVEDNPEFTFKSDTNIFQLFETGKEFVEEDKILSAILAAGTSCDGQKDRIADELQRLDTDTIHLEFDKENDIQIDCNGHAAARVLVEIKDTEKHPVYDYKENTTSLRSMQLNFYVISGNANLIMAETAPC